MSRKIGVSIGLGATLVVVMWLWLFRDKPSTPSQRYAKAAFTRPTYLSDLGKEFSIQIAGIDGLKGVPTIECGKKTTLDVTLPRKSGGVIESLFVVPRLTSQGDEGFRQMDVHCDLILALNRSSNPADPLKDDCHMRAEWKLRAGDYVVRYYRQTMSYDTEKGPPVTELLGEGRLIVVNSKADESNCGSFPLSDKKNLIPLTIIESEPKP